MKVLLLIVSLVCTTFCMGQTLTDVAISQNITYTQSTTDNRANGMSFYDFNEDGWDDLTLPVNNDSIVFYKNVNGNFQQIGSYIDAIGYVRQILWVDYDNDLDLDICVSYEDAGIRLYQNDGAFNFTDITAAAGISIIPFIAYGFSFADPDTDGDLDFYVCSHEIIGQVVSPVQNKYYENQGNGTFIEKAQLLNIDNGFQPTFMPVWFDYNNDHLLDLGLINDKEFWNDALYQNMGNGTYQDVATTVGISNDGHDPMSLSIADFNNDGYQDIFKTDIGNDVIVNGYAMDYKLYRNNSGVNFTDIAQSINLDTNMFAWGALWVDYNNDCFEDLYITTSYTDTVFGTGQSSLLYKNNNGQSFEFMNDSINGDILSSSFCPVKGDIDNNGFYDIVVLNDNAIPNVLMNSGNTNNYVKIDLLGTFSNQKGIGSTIEVYANGEHQTQTVFCGSGLCAQNSQHKIVGLGTATTIDSLIVTFPSEIVVRQFDLAANTNYQIIEQVTEVIDLNQGANTIYACEGVLLELGVPGLYNYQWNTGSQDSIITVLSQGSYSFEATNFAGDTLYISSPLYVDYETLLTYQEVINQPPCGAINNGSIELLLNPSSIVFEVYWSNGILGTMNNNLSAGQYSYTILTNGDCNYSGSITIENAPQFTVQYITAPVTDTSLGWVNLFIWGGVAPYIYTILGDTVNSPITDLSAGNYEVIVTDAYGCADTVLFTINDLSTASVSETVIDASKIYFSDGYVWVCDVNSNEIQHIEVFDMLGTLILDKHNWETDADKKCKIKMLESAASGLYRIVVTHDSFVESATIFVR
ncbi:MAG: hypothetical protein ACJAUD_001371 [Crocinitomicaceae bacterium]|jgi:hypothetical protein